MEMGISNNIDFHPIYIIVCVRFFLRATMDDFELKLPSPALHTR